MERNYQFIGVLIKWNHGATLNPSPLTCTALWFFSLKSLPSFPCIVPFLETHTHTHTHTHFLSEDAGRPWILALAYHMGATAPPTTLPYDAVGVSTPTSTYGATLWGSGPSTLRTLGVRQGSPTTVHHGPPYG